MGQCPTFAFTPYPLPTTPRCLVNCFVTENQTPSYMSHSFLITDMTNQPGSARFQALLESALHDYEHKAGVTLAEDSLAIRIQRCRSSDDITTLLQDKARAFNDFRWGGRIFKSIKATVSVLTPVSTLSSGTDDAGMVRFEALKLEDLPCLSDRFLNRKYSPLLKRYILF